MTAIRWMRSCVETASRWSRRTARTAASRPRKTGGGSADMRDDGWSNASSPGFSGNAAFSSAGSITPRTSSASFNSLASWSSSGDFEIGSSFLRGYQPDLIAHRGDEHLVIEIKSGRRTTNPSYWRSLAEEIARHPGWQFQLILGETPKGPQF